MPGLKLENSIDENGNFIEWTVAGNAVYYDNPRRDALAAIARLEGIFPICYHVQYKGEGRCKHNKKGKVA